MSSISARFFKRFVATSTLNSLAKQWLPPSVTVFMLHRIADPSRAIAGTDPEYLKRCLHYLQRNDFEFISIEEAITRSAEGRLERKKWVAFSLDDGFAEQVSVAGPIFQEFNCPATCFLITGFVDGVLWPWDYQLMYLAKHAPRQTIELEIAGKNYRLELGTPSTEDTLLAFARDVTPAAAYDVVKQIAAAANVDLPVAPPENMRATTWDEVRAMEQSGMQFGPHSVSHRILSSLSDDVLEQEIAQSKSRLAAECARPAQVFCYPSGKANEFDERAIRIVSRLQFKGALSAEPGYLDKRKTQAHRNFRFVIPRLPFPDSFNELKLYVSWAQYLREQLATDRLSKFY